MSTLNPGILTLSKLYLLFVLSITGISGSLNANETKWQAEYDQHIIMLPYADLVVPIQIASSELVLHHENLGYFNFSDGAVHSATRLPIVVADQKGAIFPYRPTLFISLRGFDTDSPPQTHAWQRDLQQYYIASLANSSSNKYSQYVHMSVVWDSDRAYQSQLTDLAAMVNQFLATRSYPWDVIVLGHSRGGIFAHHFANKILGNAQLSRLHTILLDPTGVPALGDFYPIDLYRSGSKPHYGSLFYDNQAVSFPLISPIDPFTVGDDDISGYDNYGRYDFYFNSGTTHDFFASQWVNRAGDSGFARAMNDVWAVKDVGSFAVDGDGTSRWDTVYLKADSIVADFSVDYNGGDLSAQIIINGVTTDSASFSVGLDRASVSTSSIVGASQIILRDDEVSAREDNGVVNTSIDVSSDGIHVRVDVLGLVDGDLNIDPVDILLGGGGGLPGIPPPFPF